MALMDFTSSNIVLLSTVLGVIIATVLIALLTNRFFLRQIRKSSQELNNDPTNYKFLRHLVVWLIYILGFSIAIYTVPNLRTLASSLLAGAGILAVAVGFASQQALSNVISGIFLVVFKPFRVNDRLQIRELTGVVEDITLRHTVIRNFENRRIIIPNAVMSDEIVINSDFEDGKICKWIDIGISYDSNIDVAKKIMEDEVLNHSLHIDPRSPEAVANNEPIVPVRVTRLDSSAVNLRAWAWATDVANGFVMQCDLLESIKKRFDREGINIPFPQTTISFKNDGLKFP